MKFLTDWLLSSQEYFHSLGWLGVLAFAGVMAGAGLVSSPLSPFAVSAGMIFGFWRGFVAVQVGTMLCAALNFIISRHLARSFVQRRMATHPKFIAIDAAVGREGWKIVSLLRFVPIPYGLVNYALGLTAVAFWPYIITTSITVVLANAFFVWAGTTAQAGLQAATGTGHARHPLELAMMVLGVVAALGALTYVTKIARQAVAQRDESLAAE